MNKEFVVGEILVKQLHFVTLRFNKELSAILNQKTKPEAHYLYLLMIDRIKHFEKYEEAIRNSLLFMSRVEKIQICPGMFR